MEISEGAWLRALLSPPCRTQPWEEVSVWQALGQGDEPISLGRSLDFREDAWKVHGVLLALRRHWASGSWYFKNPREAGVAFMEILLCAKDSARVAHELNRIPPKSAC